jgi:hypothetical protein
VRAISAYIALYWIERVNFLAGTANANPLPPAIPARSGLADHRDRRI